jgi:hypothetical protein
VCNFFQYVDFPFFLFFKAIARVVLSTDREG